MDIRCGEQHFNLHMRRAEEKRRPDRRNIAASLRRLRREERGMTLIELLTAEAIGGIVITAAITLVVISFNGSQRVSDRATSLSQGRILAAQIEQRINSQVCLYSGEYMVNGTTVYTGAADSIIFAGEDKLIYFADINKGGATSSNSVGFTPYLRYLYYDAGATGPTAGQKAGRLGTFWDGYREPSNSTTPFSYSLSPLTGAGALDQMGLPANANQVNPTTTRKILGEGVTNAVTGTSNTRIPFFQYYKPTGSGATAEVQITMSSGAVPTAELGNIGHIRVSYKMLAESGNDSGARNTSRQDDRTVSFASDIYFRTNPSICS